MPKYYFHNNKSINENNENNEKKILNRNTKVNSKSVVDINILLNRVKLEEKNEIKKKVIFFSFILLALGLFGTFITIIK